MQAASERPGHIDHPRNRQPRASEVAVDEVVGSAHAIEGGEHDDIGPLGPPRREADALGACVEYQST